MSFVVVSLGVFLLQNEQELLKQDHLPLDASLTDTACALIRINTSLLQYKNYVINTLGFLLSVCVCVTDVGVAVTNLRVVCKIIGCRVQNYRVHSSCHINYLEM